LLRDLQRVLLAACLQKDPAAFLRDALACGGTACPPASRRCCRAASADGLRLCHVLVMKLRLERLLRAVRRPRLRRAPIRSRSCALRALRRGGAADRGLPERGGGAVRGVRSGGPRLGSARDVRPRPKWRSRASC